ncbi:hypothetical protein AB0G02_30880, partial [Actinosynnema sp. NPDC023658]|uniref:hypothetical protein n=1 Tax=Actinosynnema sp. NPDC023658 TaxID=3155465 RepID=UPI0033EDEFF7
MRGPSWPALVLAVLLAGGGIGAGPAAAEPFDPGTTYSLRSNTQAQDVRIPVPAGLTPTEVHGRLLFDSDATGRVEVLTHDHVVATAGKAADQRELPLRFPVTAADVEDGHLLFSLRFLTGGVTDPRQVCVRSNEGTARFVDAVVELEGAGKPPDTLADFFGASVRAVSVRVPGSPDARLREAALAAQAAIVHRYTPATAVTVTTPSQGDRAAAVRPLDGRVVRLVAGEGDVRTDISAVDGVPTLTLTGDPARLTAATTALGSDLLALADSATTDRLGETGTEPGRTKITLGDLGQPAPRLAGLGQSEFDVQVSQSHFGAAVDGVRVHLVGRYAQLPPQISAVLSYYWNDRLVDSQVLRNDDTAIDRTITVPRTILTAGNTFTARLDAVPSGNDGGGDGRGFDCTGELSYLPVLASFDGNASTVEATRGQPFDPGFRRFPQVLGNVLTVAFGGSEPTEAGLTDAAALVRELQEANHDRFTVRVVDAGELIDSSTPGLLVGATADQVEQLRAPLRMAEFRAIDRRDTDFGVGVDRPFAALQAFEQNGRDLLLLSSWDPGGSSDGPRLASGLVDGIAASEDGWQALAGDLDIKQSLTGPAATIDSNSLVSQPEKVDDLSSYAWWILAFLALIGLLLLAQQLSKRRLRKRAALLVDAQEHDRGPSPRSTACPPGLLSWSST